MPLPQPTKSEKGDKDGKNRFIERCAGDKEANKTFPDQKQRLGVCYNIWDQSKQHKAKDFNDTIEGIDIIVID